MANPICCSKESVTKIFSTFKYYYCEECKKEVNDKVDLPDTAYPFEFNTSGQVTEEQVKAAIRLVQKDNDPDWQKELLDLFRGSDFSVTFFIHPSVKQLMVSIKVYGKGYYYSAAKNNMAAKEIYNYVLNDFYNETRRQS